ncbi:MAG TPA: hypothetical protein VF796_05035, partial [Humisphaera sp.]
MRPAPEIAKVSVFPPVATVAPEERVNPPAADEPIVAPPVAMVIGPTHVAAVALALVRAPAGADARPVPLRLSGSAL